MAELRDRAGKILEKVAQESGVIDAIIATRDGLAALGDLKGNGDSDTVAAMSAAALAATETAALEVGSGTVEHIQASCGGSELLIAGLDDQYILILIAESGGKAMDACQKAQQELQTVLAE